MGGLRALRDFTAHRLDPTRTRTLDHWPRSRPQQSQRSALGALSLTVQSRLAAGGVSDVEKCFSQRVTHRLARHHQVKNAKDGEYRGPNKLFVRVAWRQACDEA